MLRASHYGKMKILIPMLMNAAEVDQALQLLALRPSSSSTMTASPTTAACRLAA
jgi:phosphoenolpyruvate-protein kinase (PTS system EI component)